MLSTSDVGQTRRSDGQHRRERGIDGGEIEHVLFAGTLLDRDMVRGKRELALAAALGLLGVFLGAMQQAAAFPSWAFEVRCEFVFRASLLNFTLKHFLALKGCGAKWNRRVRVNQL